LFGGGGEEPIDEVWKIDGWEVSAGFLLDIGGFDEAINLQAAMFEDPHFRDFIGEKIVYIGVAGDVKFDG
jgi:hypothetical protein